MHLNRAAVSHFFKLLIVAKGKSLMECKIVISVIGFWPWLEAAKSFVLNLKPLMSSSELHHE